MTASVRHKQYTYFHNKQLAHLTHNTTNKKQLDLM